MRLIREEHEIFVQGRKRAAGRLELTFEEDQHGNMWLAGMAFEAVNYGDFWIEGTTRLGAVEEIVSVPIAHQQPTDNVLEFPQKGGA